MDFVLIMDYYLFADCFYLLGVSWCSKMAAFPKLTAD